MKRVMTFLAWACGSAVALAGLMTALLAWQIDRAGQGDPVTPTDVIVVMGARVLANGEPGPDLWSRTRSAVALYHQLVARGESPVLITTGGFANDPLSAAAVARRMAIEWGVPAQDIWLADGSQTTEDDARRAAQQMALHGWRSATIVSHPLHLYRSKWHFVRAGVVDVRTHPTGSLERLPPSSRMYLSGREAVAVLWGLARGWDRAAFLGRALERLVYH